MPHPIAYLSFNGNCAEAMRFYEKTLGGKLEVLMKAADSPMAEHFSKENGHLILHADLELAGNGSLYAGDHMPNCSAYEGIKGVSLTLNYATVEEAQRVFNALSEGGNVTMPMQPSFWAKAFGMLVDRFGTPWIVNGDRIPV
jgi:PhnB protein